MIGLHVGFEDVRDAHVFLSSGLQIRLDFLLWIHHSARSGATSAEQVAGAAGLGYEELAENHASLLRPCDTP